MKIRYWAALAAMIAQTGFADAPRVVTDIAPVQALTERVMRGIAVPDMIVPPGASPHAFVLRPSQARALQEADLVVWIGPGLTPWLAGVVGDLSDAAIIELNGLPQTGLLKWRGQKHGTATDHNQHGQEDGSAAGHEHHDDHEDHDDHGIQDPHSWLDPANARLWTDVIANALAERDPENASDYRRNAQNARAEIEAAAARIIGQLAPHRERPFVVYHDAFQYFERFAGLRAFDTLAKSDADTPGPGHVRALENRILEEGVTCLFTEPQFQAGIVETLALSTKARIGVLDPLGSAQAPGPAFYPDLLTAMADAMAACFEGDR